MDFTAAYCQTRRNLEQRSWGLVRRHAELTTHLFHLIGCDHDVFHGTDHDSFLATLDQCETAYIEITESRTALKEHRRDHGC